jgi:hypothetical protein
MRNWLRIVLGLLGLLALILMAACAGAPGCPQNSFGGATCAGGGGAGGFGGGGTGGGGGGGNGSVSTFAYAIDQAGTIDGFALNATGGTFAALPAATYTAPVVPTNTGGAGMVIAQSQYLYAAFGATGQIYAYTIGSTGTLTLISGSPYTASFLGGFASGSTQAAMITNPTGTLLFISDPIGGTVYSYTIGTGGVLTPVSGSPFPVPLTNPVFTPFNLATDGLGTYLYAVSGATIDHQGTQIAAYSIGSGATGTTFGALTPVVGSPFFGAGDNMFQLSGEPTGQFLIGTTGSSAFNSGVSDNDHLYVFSITQTGNNAGAITPVATSPFPTLYSPFSIAVQPTGNLVYSFGFNDLGTAFNPIEGYALSSTGTLAAEANSPYNLSNDEGSWGQFDQSGLFLFSYASFTNSSGTVVTQIAPMAVASDGTLTQAATPVSLNTPGFWVVTDPH